MSVGELKMEHRDHHLRKISIWLAVISTVLAVTLPIVPIALLLGWFTTDLLDLASRAGLSVGHAPNQLLSFIAGLLSLVPVLCLSKALWSARQYFLLIQSGIFLSRANVIALKGFGKFVAISGAAGLVLPTLIGLLLTANAGAGEKSLVVSLGSAPLLSLLFGGTLWTMAAVTAKATAIAEDHAQII